MLPLSPWHPASTSIMRSDVRQNWLDDTTWEVIRCETELDDTTWEVIAMPSGFVSDDEDDDQMEASHDQRRNRAS